jgi:hypothetical protein
MRLKVLLSALLVVTASAPLAAQKGAGGDPLTGVWSGYIGRSEAQPSAVRVEFKVGSNGGVSGSVTGPKLNPGDITAGSFDQATGALKFTVTIRGSDGDRGGLVTFDGRVVRDSASGIMVLGNQNGIFRLAKGDGHTPKATARMLGDAAEAASRGFVEVSGWIQRAAELVPAEKYAYRPAATVRTYGQMVGHVVDGMNYYCGRAAGGGAEWSDAVEKGVTTKAALQKPLKDAIAACTAAYAGASQIGPLMENVAHSSLHYGNLVTYIRMLGLVPPSS